MQELSKNLVEGVISKLGLPDADLYLFGDGSGTTLDKPCGFACIAYSKAIFLGRIRVYTGRLSHGTNNVAELMPYYHALYCDAADCGVYHINRSTIIVSDSELTVKQGQKVYGRYANSHLWRAIDSFVECGYSIKWHHVLRNTNPLNALCDKISKQERLTRPEEAYKILV